MLAEFGGHSLLTIAMVSAAVAAAIIASTPSANARQAEDMNDSLPWEYDAQNVAAYWDRRPVAVAHRSLTVTLAAAAVGLGLLMDRARGGPLPSCPDHVLESMQEEGKVVSVSRREDGFHATQAAVMSGMVSCVCMT